MFFRKTLRGATASHVVQQARQRRDKRSLGTVVRWGSLFTVFVILNLADLQLTRRLFGQWGLAAEELNPLANGLLNMYGWAGVASLKLASTTTVGLLLAIVSVFRPRLGHSALAASCLLVGAVVAYNGLLNYYPGMTGTGDSLARYRVIRERAEWLDHRAFQQRWRWPVARPSRSATGHRELTATQVR